MIAAAFAWLAGSRLGQWVVGAVAGLVALAGLLLAARASGKAAARVENLKKAVANVEQANAAKREVDVASAAGTVPDSVRKFYLPK